jgi:hypothetical protein
MDSKASVGVERVGVSPSYTVTTTRLGNTSLEWPTAWTASFVSAGCVGRVKLEGRPTEIVCSDFAGDPERLRRHDKRSRMLVGDWVSYFELHRKAPLRVTPGCCPASPGVA